MIPKECKRLAEVDFPIAVVSKHSAREKSIRHGHPSTLHLWWARRPLAACRSMLMALLLPDPCDKHCPADFKEKARALLPELVGEVGPKDVDLRKSLLRFIGDFANWDHSNHPKYLEVSRGLVKAAHPEETPLVVDPFAGGGSIPLEALRIGCDAFASDLNPVACLILKVMLEDIPRHGPKLSEELRRVGAEIKKQAEKELAGLYPKDPDGATPIAYLWARTVHCESPKCGAEIPLTRNLWLCKKTNRRHALRYKVIRSASKPPRVAFEVFEPNSDGEVQSGTVTRGKATCLACGGVLAADRVRAQLATTRGDSNTVIDQNGERVSGANLTAVVMLDGDEGGRSYRSANGSDYSAVKRAQDTLKSIALTRITNTNLSVIPDESVNPIRPSPNARGLSAVTRFGMSSFGDLFTTRQQVSLSVFSSCMQRSFPEMSAECQDLMGIALGRLVDATGSLARWLASGEEVKNVFSRQALAMVWDFAETNPLSPASRSWDSAIESIAKVVNALSGASAGDGTVQCADAAHSPLGPRSASVWFTDPPYYDAIPYADLSDYF